MSDPSRKTIKTARALPRPGWLGKPLVVVPLALVPLLVVGVVILANRDGGTSAQSEPDAAVPETAPPGRRAGHRAPADAEDGTARTGTLGEPVRPGGGLSVVVEGAALEPDPGGREELVVAVTLRNESEEPQEYGFPAFTLERDGGRVDFPAPSPRDDALRMGVLEPGESVAGVVVFRVGAGSHVLMFEWIDDPQHPVLASWELSV